MVISLMFNSKDINNGPVTRKCKGITHDNFTLTTWEFMWLGFTIGVGVYGEFKPMERVAPSNGQDNE